MRFIIIVHDAPSSTFRIKKSVVSFCPKPSFLEKPLLNKGLEHKAEASDFHAMGDLK